MREKNYTAIGQTYGLWTIVAGGEKRTPDGGILYTCICSKCGNTSYLKLSNIKRSKGRNCQKCKPEYHFVISGDIAVGTLPDGTQFKIDKEDVDSVSEYRWYYCKNTGYITSTAFSSTQIPLHRFVLGLKHEDGGVVDHINREKTDCRKSNLRVVTVQQNTLNKSMRKSNKTGYMGVSYDKANGFYMAKIQFRHNEIVLGKSRTNPVRCAQMYNIASDLLFGRDIGFKNDVPDPDKELIKTIEVKCEPLLPVTKEISQETLCMKGA